MHRRLTPAQARICCPAMQGLPPMQIGLVDRDPASGSLSGFRPQASASLGREPRRSTTSWAVSFAVRALRPYLVHACVC